MCCCKSYHKKRGLSTGMTEGRFFCHLFMSRWGVDGESMGSRLPIDSVTYLNLLYYDKFYFNVIVAAYRSGALNTRYRLCVPSALIGVSCATYPSS